MQWLDPDFIFQTVLPALNRGLVMSIALIVPSATIGFVLGVLTGVARVFGPKWLRSLGNGFTTIFRGVPLVVQLMILYFGLPNLGIYLEPYPASVLGFILCTGAYQTIHQFRLRHDLTAIFLCFIDRIHCGRSCVCVFLLSQKSKPQTAVPSRPRSTNAIWFRNSYGRQDPTAWESLRAACCKTRLSLPPAAATAPTPSPAVY